MDEDTSSDRNEIFSYIAETVSMSTGKWSGHAMEPLRYMAMMRVPWLNRQSGRDEWGFHCVGCEQNQRWPNHARRDYIMSTFKDHLKECGEIKGVDRTCGSRDVVKIGSFSVAHILVQTALSPRIVCPDFQIVNSER